MKTVQSFTTPKEAGDVFTGTNDELTAAQEAAREKADQIVRLLTEIDELGVGMSNGHLLLPAARVQRGPDGWEVRS